MVPAAAGALGGMAGGGVDCAAVGAAAGVFCAEGGAPVAAGAGAGVVGAEAFGSVGAGAGAPGGADWVCAGGGGPTTGLT